MKVIYDFMETHELQLNYESLYKYCGPNFVFIRLCIAAEIRNDKAHTNKPRYEITIDDLFKKILQVIPAHTYLELPHCP